MGNLKEDFPPTIESHHYPDANSYENADRDNDDDVILVSEPPTKRPTRKAAIKPPKKASTRKNTAKVNGNGKPPNSIPMPTPITIDDSDIINDNIDDADNSNSIANNLKIFLPQVTTAHERLSRAMASLTEAATTASTTSTTHTETHGLENGDARSQQSAQAIPSGPKIVLKLRLNGKFYVVWTVLVATEFRQVSSLF